MVRRGWIQAIVRRPIAAYESTGEMPSISAPITTGHRAIVCTRPRSPVRIHRPASSFVIILWFEMILYRESCLCTDESCAQRLSCALCQDHGGKYDKSYRLCFFFFFFFFKEKRFWSSMHCQIYVFTYSDYPFKYLKNVITIRLLIFVEIYIFMNYLGRQMFYLLNIISKNYTVNILSIFVYILIKVIQRSIIRIFFNY